MPPLSFVLGTLLFLPVIEICLFIAAGDAIGFLPTILLIILMGMAGVAMVRRQGLENFEAARRALDEGAMPVQEIFDGICLAVAGVLLLVPGFFSDFVAFALLIPELRRRLRQALVGRFDDAPAKTYRAEYIEGEFTRMDEDRIP